jgi:phosphoadenosine phosphosulfate reductase
VNDGEDPRAGRWRNLDKEECGIHFVTASSCAGQVAAQ